MPLELPLVLAGLPGMMVVVQYPWVMVQYPWVRMGVLVRPMGTKRFPGPSCLFMGFPGSVPLGFPNLSFHGQGKSQAQWGRNASCYLLLLGLPITLLTSGVGFTGCWRNSCLLGEGQGRNEPTWGAFGC